MKVCYRCRQARQLTDFIQKRNGASYGTCSGWLREIIRAPRPTDGTRRPRHTEPERTCNLCRRVLPGGSFMRRSNGSSFSACKDCKTNVFTHRRCARLAEAEGRFTTAEWDALRAQYDRCPGCEGRWQEIPCPSG